MAGRKNKPHAGKEAWRSRCVVVAPRHEFIRPWIRAYFSTGNTIPLVIATGPKGDWKDGDMEYCEAAATFSGGMVLDCGKEWKKSEKLKERACLENRIGWYSKKSILYAVAKKLSPKSWAWIDDDAEITGNIDECFDYAERTNGFICAEFYYPGEIDNRHPSKFQRKNVDKDWKLNWNSFVFFHGEANLRIAEELGKDFPVEDDECIFFHLYRNNDKWRDGFSDFSIRQWQANCKTMNQIPKNWSGKLIHYTTWANGGEVKRFWAKRAESLPLAPFENTCDVEGGAICEDGPVDAVFVIGKGSLNGNEELRYALRNISEHCPFIRDVYICGECPQWVDKSAVKHLQWPDRFSHAKDANIIDKLRHACEHPGISKRILFCSDDQFQTRICTWDDFAPRYLRRYSRKDKWYGLKKRVWHSRLRNTLERDADRRRKCGLEDKDVFYYQPHMWMQIDRDKFIAYAKWCGYERRYDTIIASGYFNFIDAGGFPDKDDPVTFLGMGSGLSPKAKHVAYNDGSYGAAMTILRDMFPNKCRFEIGYKDGSQDNVQTQTASVATPRDDHVETWDSGCDPSPATSDELSRILEVMSKIRDNPTWNMLLVETSRAEELRLFGVKGWRIVWEDIVSRWSRATNEGENDVPVSELRSASASSVVNAYMSDPESMRTVKFGASIGQKPEYGVRSGFMSLQDRVRAITGIRNRPI